MANICLALAYDMAIGFCVDLAPYPTVRRVHEELIGLDAFKTVNWAVWLSRVSEIREQEFEVRSSP